MRLRIVILLSFAFLSSGCVSYIRRSPNFDESINHTKTIAVMPPDVKVIRITAGNIEEQMDEWTDQAKIWIEESLKKNLGHRFGFNIKFIDEKWLKTTDKSLWRTNSALYAAVSDSALMHTYIDFHKFPQKLKNFDYTLGPELNELAELCEADSLVFVYGFDYEATTGRKALGIWNAVLGAAVGAQIIQRNPTFLSMGLVDGQTGDLVLYKINASNTEYSFRNQKNIDVLLEWMTRDFLKKK